MLVKVAGLDLRWFMGIVLLAPLQWLGIEAQKEEEKEGKEGQET